MNLTSAELARIDWDKGAGLVPVVVQDAGSAAVLMLGYMNREALQRTLETRRVTFFSRSRQRLWQKGETSGNQLQLRAVRLDCDGDTLLLQAIASGPVCHTGTATCFGDTQPPPLAFNRRARAHHRAADRRAHRRQLYRPAAPQRYQTHRAEAR